jgi:hypothetical protein
MAQQIKLSIHIAWWLKPYLHVLAFFCVLTCNVPDQMKLSAKIKRAMRVTIE